MYSTLGLSDTTIPQRFDSHTEYLVVRTIIPFQHHVNPSPPETPNTIAGMIVERVEENAANVEIRDTVAEKTWSTVHLCCLMQLPWDITHVLPATRVRVYRHLAGRVIPFK